MHRHFCLVILLSSVAASCGWRDDIGGHDFCWPLDAKKDPPWQYMWGWVRWNHQKPVCAICALTDTVESDKSHTDADGRQVKVFSGFDGRSIRVPSNKKVIYALQRDQSLREIPLTDQEVDTALAILDDLNHRVYAPDNPLIKTKILPQLEVAYFSQ